MRIEIKNTEDFAEAFGVNEALKKQMIEAIYYCCEESVSASWAESLQQILGMFDGMLTPSQTAFLCVQFGDYRHFMLMAKQKMNDEKLVAFMSAFKKQFNEKG
jgi:hypothetical protein